jgi:SnoaL-like domain
MLNTDREALLQRLLDLEEIRRLKHRYVNLCDANYQAEPLADLFVDDGVWTGPADYGHHVGREQLIAFFRRLGGGGALFTVHMVGNEEIDVDVDRARGRWTTIAPCTFKIEGAAQDFWGFLRYDDEFLRIDGKWKFQKIRATALAGGPHLSGWAASVGKR